MICPKTKATTISLVLHIVIVLLAVLAAAGMSNVTVITETELYVVADVSYSTHDKLDLIDDYIEVKEAGDGRLTIPKRIVRFFRDYKSEVKKIVWPGLNEVVKNTGIVLIMCLIIGALIWVIDFGLAELLHLVLGIKA